MMTLRMIITTAIAALVLASPLPSRDTTATRPAEVPDTTEVRFDDDWLFEDNAQKQQLPVSDPNEVTLVRTRRGRVYLDKARLFFYLLSGRNTSGDFIQYRDNRK